MPSRRPRLAPALLLCASGLVWSAPLQADEVEVERQGQHLRIDAVMHTAASPARAFAVLTDFEHMVGRVPNLQRSQVLERQGLRWIVSQQGEGHWGPFSMPFESVREVRLNPPVEIRAHQLSGSARQMDSVMTLSPEPGGGTRLHYHAELDVAGFFPPGLGPAAVRHETAEQFSALLHEMDRQP